MQDIIKGFKWREMYECAKHTANTRKMTQAVGLTPYIVGNNLQQSHDYSL